MSTPLQTRIRPKEHSERVIAVIVLFVIFGLLVSFQLFGNLERDLLFVGWSVITFVLAVFTLMIAAIVTEKSRTFALLALGPLLLLVLFATGLMLADGEVSKKPNYQVLLDKGSLKSSPQEVRLLRNYQRGLLVRRPGEKIVEFIPWSEIRALKQIAPSSSGFVLPAHLATSRNSISSINVGSSAGARELLTRFDTGQRRSTSFATGLSISTPASPDSHGSN